MVIIHNGSRKLLVFAGWSRLGKNYSSRMLLSVRSLFLQWTALFRQIAGVRTTLFVKAVQVHYAMRNITSVM